MQLVRNYSPHLALSLPDRANVYASQDEGCVEIQTEQRCILVSAISAVLSARLEDLSRNLQVENSLSIHRPFGESHQASLHEQSLQPNVDTKRDRRESGATTHCFLLRVIAAADSYTARHHASALQFPRWLQGAINPNNCIWLSQPATSRRASLWHHGVLRNHITIFGNIFIHIYLENGLSHELGTMTIRLSVPNSTKYQSLIFEWTSPLNIGSVGKETWIGYVCTGNWAHCSRHCQSFLRIILHGAHIPAPHYTAQDFTSIALMPILIDVFFTLVFFLPRCTSRLWQTPSRVESIM